ncbi:MAG: SDR family oxidoreductase [Deltaproteobacteria bacterium]|nr:SDR family oxidoreductase [Deltaproteobacteria bacterium]
MQTSIPFCADLLAGQVWLITGGGTGIGRTTAELAARLGARVVIASRKAERLAVAAQAIRDQGGLCLELTCDIREPEQVEALVRRTLDELGRLDVLVNNAGGQFPTTAESLSRKGWDAVIRNNLSGTWYVTQEAAQKAFIPARRGAVVNVIANVYRGFAGMVHTGAARAGVDNLTKTLAVEWSQYGIRVNAVAPGIIQSSGLDQYPPELVARTAQAIPFKRLGTTHEVAVPIVFLGSPAASYVTGVTLYVDGGSRLWGDIFPLPDAPATPR